MEPEVVAGMVFTLILTVMVGGFILLFPLSRRLGALLENRLEDKKAPPRLPDAELAAMREAIEQRVADILADVRQRGDAAVLDLSDVPENSPISGARIAAAGAHLRRGDIAILKTRWDERASIETPDF